MTRYGVSVQPRDSGRGLWMSVWSGAFMSTWEAQGYPRDGAKRITLTTYNDDKVIVHLPEGVTFPRTAKNYEVIDAAIGDALNEYERARGSIQMIPDLPPGDDGKPTELPDPPAPGADDE